MLLRLPNPAARFAVLATAFSPMALFFSAVYTDALYMALSIADRMAILESGKVRQIGKPGELYRIFDLFEDHRIKFR